MSYTGLPFANFPGKCRDKNNNYHPENGASHNDTTVWQCYNWCKARGDCIAFSFDTYYTIFNCYLYAKGPYGPYTHGNGAADTTCYIIPEGILLTFYKYVCAKIFTLVNKQQFC